MSPLNDNHKQLVTEKDIVEYGLKHRLVFPSPFEKSKPSSVMVINKLRSIGFEIRARVFEAILKHEAVAKGVDLMVDPQVAARMMIDSGDENLDNYVGNFVLDDQLIHEDLNVFEYLDFPAPKLARRFDLPDETLRIDIEDAEEVTRKALWAERLDIPFVKYCRLPFDDAEVVTKKNGLIFDLIKKKLLPDKRFFIEIDGGFGREISVRMDSKNMAELCKVLKLSKFASGAEVYWALCNRIEVDYREELKILLGLINEPVEFQHNEINRYFKNFMLSELAMPFGASYKDIREKIMNLPFPKYFQGENEFTDF